MCGPGPRRSSQANTGVATVPTIARRARDASTGFFMSQPQQPIIALRRAQMFPVLEAADIARLERFGERATYATGDRLFTTGEISPGLFVIHSGTVDVTQRGHSNDDKQLIVSYGPGHFMGELAQLSNRPSLVDAYATSDVEALIIPSRRLRDVLVEDADLGERIMRALILRRVGLAGSRRRRAGDRRPRGQARCAAAGEFSSTQRPPAPAAGSRSGFLCAHLGRALSYRTQ